MVPTLIEVYNNIPHRQDLIADWGYSCQVHEAGLLFDTGAEGDILLSNMQGLKIDPTRIRQIVLSHDHWDHTGGLQAILATNPSVEVFVHDDFSEQILGQIREHTSPVILDEWTEIHSGIAVTGPLGDDVKEQSLVVTVADGLLVVTGCAHPHITEIVNRVSREGQVWGVIGGLHTVTDEDIDSLAGMVYISASHCTNRIEEIQKRYPETFQPGGVGKVHLL